MRIVTTSMYFEYDDVRGYQGYRRRMHEDEDRNPGVAFAWFAGDTSRLPDFSNLKLFRQLPRGRSRHPDPEQIRGILDLFVRDVDEPGFLRIPSDASVENANIIDFILEEGLVIERSPPILI